MQGLDVYKKTINYCVKDGSGRIYAAGSIRATIRVGHVDEDASPAVEGSHGSDHLHGLDLRSSQPENFMHALLLSTSGELLPS